MKTIKIAIADDHQLFLEGLKFIISSFSNVEVVIEANNGQELLKSLADRPVDVVLMDLDMPILDGIETTKEVKMKYPELKIILLTMHNSPNLITNMMQLGANGYLVKDEKPQILYEAIQSVVNKDYFFNEYVFKALLEENKEHYKNKKVQLKKSSQETSFSNRELEILQLICLEYTGQEIAKKLYLSPKTVEGHRQKLLRKTGSKNTAGLVIFAIKNNLVEVNSPPRNNLEHLK